MVPEIIFWSSIIVIAIALEINTVSLTSIWFALAGCVSLILAILKIPFIWQLVAFAGTAAITLLVTRPIARKFTKNTSIHTNADKVLEKIGIITKRISEEEIGEVKVNNELWRAITTNNETIEVGEKVLVNSIIGNKVLVTKINENKIEYL